MTREEAISVTATCNLKAQGTFENNLLHIININHAAMKMAQFTSCTAYDTQMGHQNHPML